MENKPLHYVPDLKNIVGEFKKSLSPYDRDVSFDYCYNYFRKTKPSELTNDTEKSCLVLGFYLASWGMLRASSFLLQKSIKHYEPTVKYLSKLKSSTWEIDIDNYDDAIKTILEIYKDLEGHLAADEKTPTVTLVTKVMLGVFGFIPAYDQNFVKAFSKKFKGDCSFTRVNEKSLQCLNRFYDDNKEEIDNCSLETFTVDFSTGQKTKINYPKAKIIDMYGFTVGENQ